MLFVFSVLLPFIIIIIILILADTKFLQFLLQQKKHLLYNLLLYFLKPALSHVKL